MSEGWEAGYFTRNNQTTVPKGIKGERNCDGEQELNGRETVTKRWKLMTIFSSMRREFTGEELEREFIDWDDGGRSQSI